MVACLGRAQPCCPFQRHTQFLLPFPLKLPFKVALPFAVAHFTHLAPFPVAIALCSLLLPLPLAHSLCLSPGLVLPSPVAMTCRA